MPLLPVLRLRLPRLVGIEIAENLSYRGMKRLFHCGTKGKCVPWQLRALEIQQAIQEVSMARVIHEYVSVFVFVTFLSSCSIFSFSFSFFTRFIYLHSPGDSLLTEIFKNSLMTFAKGTAGRQACFYFFLLLRLGVKSSNTAPDELRIL